MAKRILTMVFAVLFAMATLSGCNWQALFRAPYDEALEDQVDMFQREDGMWCLEYKGNIYIDNTEYLMKVHQNEETDVLLGWSGIGYYNHYHSYTDQEPLYIYEGRMGEVYILEGHDFRAGNYRVNDTDIVIRFDEMLAQTDVQYDPSEDHGQEIVLDLNSERFPALYLGVKLFREDGLWYLTGTWFASDRPTGTYRVTDAFLALLIEKGIIDTDGSLV